MAVKKFHSSKCLISLLPDEIMKGTLNVAIKLKEITNKIFNFNTK